MQQRRVHTVQPVQEAQKSTVPVQLLRAVDTPVRCATTGAGVQPAQAALEFHSCSAQAVGAAAWGEEGGVLLLSDRE